VTVRPWTPKFCFDDFLLFHKTFDLSFEMTYLLTRWLVSCWVTLMPRLLVWPFLLVMEDYSCGISVFGLLAGPSAMMDACGGDGSVDRGVLVS
jgi:hypothetical protein